MYVVPTEKGVRALGTGVTGDCEPPPVDAGNQTLVLGRAGNTEARIHFSEPPQLLSLL